MKLSKAIIGNKYQAQLLHAIERAIRANDTRAERVLVKEYQRTINVQVARACKQQ